MHAETISFDDTECFSSFFKDYINQKEPLRPFYEAFPNVDNFEKAIEQRRFDSSTRQLLADALEEQYKAVTRTPEVDAHIELLRSEKTFTVTTGHQLNIFTGPLYFIYKIVTTINACKKLKQAYPAYHFVPVYWMASEDHDFEEISYFRYEGTKRVWETDQQGAVGRFDPSALREIAASLPKSASFFESAYSAETLASAVRHYVHDLFGEHGLVVVDADSKRLKSILKPVIKADIFQNEPEKVVEQTSSSLKSLGYKTQVHARPINFFYLKEGIRERIEKAEGGFQVVDTDIHFSEEQMRALIENEPEVFSPNVILRPLYQEMILPNLAYVGGPSELVYWLQLKDLFAAFHTAFPLLMPRNFALVIGKSYEKKWAKTGLTWPDLFKSKNDAFSRWVVVNSNQELSYQQELKDIQELYGAMAGKAHRVDPSLTQHLEALYVGYRKKIEKAEKKLLRAEKRNYSEKFLQIEAVKDDLFPNGNLQERTDNFLNFYVEDPQFLEKLLATFDAFDFRMYLLFE